MNMRIKSSLRKRAERAKKKRCKNLITVLENPKTIANVGSAIRNVDALGVEKLYVVDGYNLLPDDWQKMRANRSLNTISVSAIKWAYVKRFNSTKECLEHLKDKGFTSFATSPHQKGNTNISLEDSVLTPKKLAIWFGNESQGLSEEAIGNCQKCLQIQMGGIIESLNLGSSTGIVMYEATKQRRAFDDKKF